MANQVAPHVVPEREPAAVTRPRRGGLLGWLLFLLMLGLSALAVKYVHQPLSADRDRLGVERDAAKARAQRLAAELEQSRARLDGISGEREKLAGELALTVAEKAQIEAELKRVQGELAAKLEPEIESGNVAIKRQGDQLIVDVSDRVLFETGQADVSERGQKVLIGVAPTLLRVEGYTIEVRGHTDGTRIVSAETQSKFPTNWELSTARATNVVRFLQEQGKLPGSRLVAAGFAEFRPVASNASNDGRKKNRRIEIALVPRRAGS